VFRPHPRHCSARRLHALLAALCLAPGLAACKSGASAADVERKREWLEFGLLADARLHEGADGILSGPGGYFAAGHNLGPGNARLLAGLEGQLAFSYNEVDPPAGSLDRLSLLRGDFGGRLAWSPPGIGVTPVLRAGGYYRWSFGGSGEGPASLDPQGAGWYAGVGLEFVAATEALAHLFVTTYVPADLGEPDELIIGIGVTSHL